MGNVTTALTDADLDHVDAMLSGADRLRVEQYPGDLVSRQPVHTVYVPADRVDARLSERWGAAAAAALTDHAPTPAVLAAATGQAVTRLLTEAARESGVAVLLVTHDPAVGEHAERIVTLRSGRLEADSGRQSVGVLE